MIIQGLLNVLYSVLSVLTAPISIPKMPADALSYIEQFFSYLEAGAGILANYTPFAYLMVLFGILLAVDIGIGIYHFVMWILRKIPVAGIS